MFSRKHGKKTVEEEDDVFPVYSQQSQEDMTAIVSALSQVIGSDETTSNSHGEMAYSTSSAVENQPPPVIQQSPDIKRRFR
ncbi:hypothetical protein Hdeb2414_s0004g00120991 [Helianthus debilis subsp. tardiflorus]